MKILCLTRVIILKGERCVDANRVIVVTQMLCPRQYKTIARLTELKTSEKSRNATRRKRSLLFFWRQEFLEEKQSDDRYQANTTEHQPERLWIFQFIDEMHVEVRAQHAADSAADHAIEK